MSVPHISFRYVPYAWWRLVCPWRQFRMYKFLGRLVLALWFPVQSRLWVEFGNLCVRPKFPLLKLVSAASTSRHMCPNWQPGMGEPDFPQLEPGKSGHDSIFVDWVALRQRSFALPQSFPLLQRKKKKSPINFHFFYLLANLLCSTKVCFTKLQFVTF